MTGRKKLGVVLFQLGGPDSLGAVEPFLFNLFSDPDIFNIPFGFLLRKPLARRIARKRAPHATEHYKALGGASPLLRLTERQKRALEHALRPHVDPLVVIAMRYWHPFTEEAIGQLEASQPDEIVLLPLYPQYSIATTGSSLNEWQRRFRGARIPVHKVERFYDDRLYIQALTEKIQASLNHFDPARLPVSKGREKAHLLFSAHGVPKSFIQRGDPYQREVEATVRLVMEHGKWPNSHSLCYQSKVGPEEWLGPSLHDELRRLAAAKVTQVLVVPISFVSEHVETLHEINMEAREEAAGLGISLFRMAPAVGDSPTFIACLADLVLTAAGQPKASAG